MDREPTIGEWRKLFQAAQSFYELAPWEWVFDFDIFGIQNPETKEVGYASILGNLGEVFGLCVYLGSEGLTNYLRLQGRDPEEIDWDVVVGLRCLTAFFEDREDLDPRDRDVIKKLGLKFRGRKAWPVFRSHRPGYAPWYLTSSEARFLTVALLQAQHVAKRLLDDPELLDRAPDDLYLVRVRTGKRWRDEWQPPPPPPPLVFEPLPEEVVSALRAQNRPRNGVWEVDLFLLPTMIQERKDSPPYYVSALLCVHQESYFVVGIDLVPYWNRLTQLQRRFAKVLEKSPIGWPKRVLVKRLELLVLLSPLLEDLGIEIELAPRLPALEEVQQSFIAFLTKRALS